MGTASTCGLVHPKTQYAAVEGGLVVEGEPIMVDPEVRTLEAPAAVLPSHFSSPTAMRSAMSALTTSTVTCTVFSPPFKLLGGMGDTFVFLSVTVDGVVRLLEVVRPLVEGARLVDVRLAADRSEDKAGARLGFNTGVVRGDGMGFRPCESWRRLETATSTGLRDGTFLVGDRLCRRGRDWFGTLLVVVLALVRLAVASVLAIVFAVSFL